MGQKTLRDITNSTPNELAKLLKKFGGNGKKILLETGPDRTIIKIVPNESDTRLTITLGQETRKSLKEKMKKSSLVVSKNALAILGKMPLAKEPQELDLVILPAGDLVPENDFPSIAEIHDGAKKRGLELCPAETGPYLAITYPGKKGEWLHIAMEPIGYGSESPGSFLIRRDEDGKKYLEVVHGENSMQWQSKTLFIFVQPRENN